MPEKERILAVVKEQLQNENGKFFCFPRNFFLDH